MLPSKFFNLTKFLLFRTPLISTLLGNENIRKSSFDWSLVSNQKQKTEYISRQFSERQEAEEIKKKKFLRVVYFHPADKAPLKDFSKRWDAILCDFQEFYRSEMIRLRYGPLTISLEINNIGLVRTIRFSNSLRMKKSKSRRGTPPRIRKRFFTLTIEFLFEGNRSKWTKVKYLSTTGSFPQRACPHT